MWNFETIKRSLMRPKWLKLGQIKKNTSVWGNPTLPKFTGETQIFFRFHGKKIIVCILKGKMKGKMPFKMHKIIFFSRIKKIN